MQMALPTPLISERIIDVVDMQPMDINAWDIGWSLSTILRYRGHTSFPWSLLSHTGLGYAWIAGNPEVNDSTKLAYALHEAPKCYLGDIPRHLKDLLRMAASPDPDAQIVEPFKQMEERVYWLILERFGINPADVDFDIIKKYDDHAAALEMHLLMPKLYDAQWFNANKTLDVAPDTKLIFKRHIVPFMKVLKDTAIYAMDTEALFNASDDIREFLSSGGVG